MPPSGVGGRGKEGDGDFRERWEDGRRRLGGISGITGFGIDPIVHCSMMKDTSEANRALGNYEAGQECSIIDKFGGETYRCARSKSENPLRGAESTIHSVPIDVTSMGFFDSDLLLSGNPNIGTPANRIRISVRSTPPERDWKRSSPA